MGEEEEEGGKEEGEEEGEEEGKEGVDHEERVRGGRRPGVQWVTSGRGRRVLQRWGEGRRWGGLVYTYRPV
jgi:hypothetical protein